MLNIVVAPFFKGFFSEDGVLFHDVSESIPAFVTEGNEGGAGVLGVGSAGGESTFFKACDLPGNNRLAEVQDSGDVVNANTARTGVGVPRLLKQLLKRRCPLVV